MDPAPVQKIVNFPSSVVSPEAVVCELCGSPTLNSACRKCAIGLLDLGFSTTEQEFPRLVDEAAADSSPSEPPSRRYGHYEICESAPGVPWELGRGAMGITYKAVDTNLGSVVALKIINSLRLGDSSDARFSREAKAAAQLSHANIARVFHLGWQGADSFYVMEFVEGETLEAFIRREGALPWQLALSIVTQCAQALRVAHGRGFIHRDIKPTNIMLVRGEHASEADFVVKIIDFGLVKGVSGDDDVHDAVSLTYFAGTPYFASPEQWEGSIDARTDIYSLGICFWYMLTGKPPRLAVSSVDGWRRSQPPPLPALEALEGVPEPVATLLRTMVSPEPALRPQSAAELLDTIQKILPDAQSGKSVGPAPLQKPGNMWLRMGLLVAVVVVALPFAARSVRETGSLSGELPNLTTVPVADREARALYEQGEEFRGRFTKADNQHAVALYTEALSRAPYLADAYAGLSLAKYQSVVRFGAASSEMDLAVANARKAISYAPKSPKGYHALAAVRSFQGQPWEALAELRQALELDPKNVPVMRDFSMSWCSVGKPHFALAWAKTANGLKPSDLRVLTAIADASVDLCDDEQARECYRQCFVINPAWMAARCGAIHVDILEGDFARAREDYAMAKSINAEPIYSLTLKAQIDLFTGKYEEAEMDYRQLLTMDRTGLVRYYGGISYLSALGFLRCQAGDTKEGEAFLEEAAKLYVAHSDGPQAIYDLAAIRLIQGLKDDALALLSQANASGWNDYRVMRLDPRFEALRQESRFIKMTEELSSRVSGMHVDAEKLCAKPLNLADYPVQPPRE